MHDVSPDSDETRGLLDAVRRGDDRARDELLRRHRPTLIAFVQLHLDRRLRARVDPSDVVQDAQLEAARRLDDYLQRQPMPFRIWLRKTAYERLLNLRRDHLRRARRSVQREEPWPDHSSVLLANALRDHGPSPSQLIAARELAERVDRAVAAMPEADREILLMRNVEKLPYEEIACLLDVDPAAARKRYGRALIRLQRAISDEGPLE